MLALKEPGARQMSVEGILNLAKPSGWTSHDVVAKLRGALKNIRVGHAGTLDPAATGVLPILLGRGTRIAEYLLEWDKEYRAVLRLGQTTDTLDATGIVLTEDSTDALTSESIHAACAQFVGEIVQVPPMYSAVKVAGVPLYKSARAGKTIERDSRRVKVYDLRVMTINGRDVTFYVRCSKGTYIRTLCADIGSMLKVGGHLLQLTRQRVGPLCVEHACTLDEAIDSLRAGRPLPRLLTLNAALAHVPALIVSDMAAERACHGGAIPFQAVQWERSATHVLTGDRRIVRITDSHEQLVGIGLVQGHEPSEDGAVAMVKVLADMRQATS
jgi:tRNA pseudouridine55 synthase